MEREPDYTDTINAIKTAELPDAEKLARAFEWVTGRIIAFAQNDVELARALHDQETLIKHQIKLETVKMLRDVFSNCYRAVIGGYPDHE